MAGEPYELVFTHHVLEHVYDLDKAWDSFVQLLKPRSGMVHILPCGNAGSFEFQLCSLRKGGINGAAGNRFFFEDEGHLRRLCTEDLERKASQDGFTLKMECYANQWYGAIDWITQAPLQYVRNISDPSVASDRSGRHRLSVLRSVLLVFAWARFFLAEYRRIYAMHPNRFKHRLFLVGSSPVYLLARWADGFLKSRVQREWETHRGRREGSEMYLYFSRE